MFTLILENSTWRFFSALLDKFHQVIEWKTHIIVVLDRLIGIHDDGDEEAQYHINEEGDKGVEVDTGEPPHHRILARGGREGGKHVVSVDEGVQALHCGWKGAEL